MRKATVIESGAFVTGAVIAAGLAMQLAQHGVGAAVIVAVVACTLTTGLYLGIQIGQGLRTRLFACPVKGCVVSIRARNVDPAGLERLRTLATDHSKH